MAKASTVDGYIAALPPEARAVATRLRETITNAVPEATTAIKYDMPAFLVRGRPFLYFAVWKKHVGLYPLYTCEEALERDVAPYRDKKDTLRFPLNEAIPHALIARVAQYKSAREG
jgi:uncharacterized protein YdhG (YjbR/CyaY superfamily)